MNPVLLDSGFIVALLDRRDRRHSDCVAAMEIVDRPLVTCEAVISESCYLLRRVPGAKESILANVEAGVFNIGFQLVHSVAAVRGIMRKYSDQPVDFADACLIRMADELDTGDILTLDSDFRTYRWRGTRTFHLLVASEP
ncbi:MAG TPA: PIN domain-containing protein [Acidobacteriaceae bacterium]